METRTGLVYILKEWLEVTETARGHTPSAWLVEIVTGGTYILNWFHVGIGAGKGVSPKRWSVEKVRVRPNLLTLTCFIFARLSKFLGGSLLKNMA